MELEFGAGRGGGAFGVSRGASALVRRGRVSACAEGGGRPARVDRAGSPPWSRVWRPVVLMTALLGAGCSLGEDSRWPPPGPADPSGPPGGDGVWIAPGGEGDALDDAGTPPGPGDGDGASAPGDADRGDAGPPPEDGGGGGPVLPPLDPEPIFEPPTGETYASWVRRPFTLPLGISTAGYGQAPGPDRTYGPYAEAFYSSRDQYAPPNVRALAFFRGERRVILVQTDLIAIREVLVAEVLVRLLARTGVDMTDELLLMANHTHAGPARWIPHPIAGLVADVYHGEVLARVADDITDTVLAALVEAEPVHVGHGWAHNDELHNDRRCENPPLEDGTMGLLRVDRARDGSPLALVMSYGVHCTVFAPQDLHYSGDVAGLIEQKVAERFSEPVGVMFVQSWAGDMSPGNPSAKYEVQTSVPMSGKRKRLEALGMSAADTVVEALPGIETTPDVDIGGISLRVPASYQAIGYELSEFAYEHGGFFCGGDNSECKNGFQAVMESCLPLPPEYAIAALRMGAVRIGELVLFSLPGEPVTQYTLDLVDRIRADTGATDLWPVGYAMDHVGYLMDPWDWWAGGYEAAFTFLGPRQGEYAGEMARLTVRAVLGLPYEIPNLDLVGPVPRGPDVGEPFIAEESVNPGTPEEQPIDPASTSVARFVWRGGDPLVDQPRVTLQETLDDAGMAWIPVLDPSGAPLDSGSYLLAIRLDTEPTYHPDNFHLAPRTFLWTVELLAERPIPSAIGDLRDRTFRFRVEGHHAVAGEAVPYELASTPFDFGGGVMIE